MCYCCAGEAVLHESNSHCTTWQAWEIADVECSLNRILFSHQGWWHVNTVATLNVSIYLMHVRKVIFSVPAVCYYSSFVKEVFLVLGLCVFAQAVSYCYIVSDFSLWSQRSPWLFRSISYIFWQNGDNKSYTVISPGIITKKVSGKMRKRTVSSLNDLHVDSYSINIPKCIAYITLIYFR